MQVERDQSNGFGRLFERERGQIRVNSLYPSWLVFGGGFDQSPLRSGYQAIFDIAASGILLVVTLPVMFITALCILLEDGAPIFYRQERVGKGGNIYGSKVSQYGE